MRIPHPIPYQGSKRAIAGDILRCFPSQVDTIIEPFAGSGAISLAAATQGLVSKVWLNDLNRPLMDLWKAIVCTPDGIAAQYGLLWRRQLEDPRQFYDDIRDEFNDAHRSDHFLYLLARCVKASVRYNAAGEFNQSPDNRRLGMRPETMRRMILGASGLLQNRTRITSRDYRDVVLQAEARDLIYMDPPYQGVCQNRDGRYLCGIDFDEFVDTLDKLNRADVMFIVSYDGRTGTKVHGKSLPEHLNLIHTEINAGVSTQATLLGRRHNTVESLYLSPALTRDLSRNSPIRHQADSKQLFLLDGFH